MSDWQFLVIIACAVAGFMLVSFVVEARGPKQKATGQTETNNSSDRARSDSTAQERLLWFEVLGVVPTASVAEIKTAYRLRAQQYHPDRVEGLGLELRQIAEQKMKELNIAYQSGLQARQRSA
jgi:DnaJ-class molecular chaperone